MAGSVISLARFVTSSFRETTHDLEAAQQLHDLVADLRELNDHLKFKRGLSGSVDGFAVSALADTGAAHNVVSCNFARAWKLDVAGSPGLFRQGNSKLALSLGMSKNYLNL